MDFNLKQLREDALLAEGRYKFRVLHTREKTSPKGTGMFILKLALDVNGRSVNQFCTLLLMPSMIWLFEHFCKATGLFTQAEAGRLMAQDCDGKEGLLEMKHRVNKETGELEAYVKDFIVAEAPTEFVSFDEDVPNFV